MLLPVFQCNDPRWKRVVKQHNDFFYNALQFVFDELVLPRKSFSVGVTFVSDEEIRTYNAAYRHKDKATNVLSFPMIDDFSDLKKLPEPIELGDIVIAYETVLAEAKAQKKSTRDHTAHLLVHGCLHLFGYDHMTDDEADEMEALEIRILDHLDITNPYL